MSIFSPLTDAIFEPLAARQQVERARFDASATANNVLLEVAELHFELLAAEADLRVRRKSAAQEAEVARLTRAYAQAGQGRRGRRTACRDRIYSHRERDSPGRGAVCGDCPRLSRRLHLVQSVRLRPIAPTIEMVTIVDPSVSVPELIQTALQGRPEYRARRRGSRPRRPIISRNGIGRSCPRSGSASARVPSAAAATWSATSSLTLRAGPIPTSRFSGRSKTLG